MFMGCLLWVNPLLGTAQTVEGAGTTGRTVAERVTTMGMASLGPVPVLTSQAVCPKQWT